MPPMFHVGKLWHNHSFPANFTYKSHEIEVCLDYLEGGLTGPLLVLRPLSVVVRQSWGIEQGSLASGEGVRQLD